MKLKSLNNSEEISEKVVLTASAAGYNNSLSITLISNFSQKQVINFIIMILIIINVKLEQRLENFNINR